LAEKTRRGLPLPFAGATVSLDDEAYPRLAETPEIEWFANLTNANTQRAYRSDVRGFMAFLGVAKPEELRRVRRPHVIGAEVPRGSARDCAAEAGSRIVVVRPPLRSERGRREPDLSVSRPNEGRE